MFRIVKITSLTRTSSLAGHRYMTVGPLVIHVQYHTPEAMDLYLNSCFSDSLHVNFIPSYSVKCRLQLS